MIQASVSVLPTATEAIFRTLEVIHTTASAIATALPSTDHAGEEAHKTPHNEHFLFIQALLMLTLILISLNINRFLHAKKFHYLSESAVMILLGFIVAIGWTAISYDAENKTIQLNSSFFYLVLLPPIIFEVHFIKF
jgi:uncharacterized membrane protein YhaH (DUF805 family)